MPEKDNKILKYNQGKKSMKVPFTKNKTISLIIIEAKIA